MATIRVAAVVAFMVAATGCSGDEMSAPEWCAAAGVAAGRSEARSERVDGAKTIDDLELDEWDTQAEATALLAQRPPAEIADEVTELSDAAIEAVHTDDTLPDGRFEELTDTVTTFLSDECGIDSFTGTMMYASLMWNERQQD